MAGEARDDEATWRELVAQYRTPAAADGAVPWPLREELSSAQQAPPGAPGPAGAPGATDTSMDSTDERGASAAPGTPRTGTHGAGDPAAADPVGADPGAGSPGTGDPGTGDPGTGDPGTGHAGGPGGQAGPRTDGKEPGRVPPSPRGWDPVPGVIPAQPQTRIVRPAAQAPIPPAGDDEHYVPPVPPPLPRLDPVSKGAWAALFGGPGYLLLAVLLGWVVPGWAAFCAVGAFVGGFATLVVRMGDRPPGDSGPGDGAVV
jgi:hypothetical protein